MDAHDIELAFEIGPADDAGFTTGLIARWPLLRLVDRPRRAVVQTAS